jgi:hypothetical protein
MHLNGAMQQMARSRVAKDNEVVTRQRFKHPTPPNDDKTTTMETERLHENKSSKCIKYLCFNIICGILVRAV